MKLRLVVPLVVLAVAVLAGVAYATFIALDNLDFMKDTGIRLSDVQGQIKVEEGQTLKGKIVNAGKLESLGAGGFHNDDLVKVTYLGDYKWKVRKNDGSLTREFKWKPNQ